ncbi:MAG: hypothetical protein WCH78_09820 [Bacteroidota bacterium]
MRKCFLLSLLITFTFPMLAMSAVSFSDNGKNLMAISHESSFSDTINWSKKKTAPWFVDRFKISAGLFAATTTTDIKLGASGGGSIGTDIDFEKDLGLKRNVETFIGNFQWRLSRRWRMDFSFYQLNRSATKTLERTVIFGDNTYNVTANVNTFFNTTIYRVSIGYAILAKPTYELGLLLGTHTLQSKMGLGISAGGAGVSFSDNFKFTAPLPDLGIWGGVVLSKKLSLNGEFDYLSIAAGNVKGRIVGYNASLLFNVAKHFDLAIGYTGFDFSLDENANNQSAHIGWGYRGPSITGNFRFGHNNWKH